MKKLSYRHRIICAIPYSLLHFLIEYNCLKQYLDNCCKDSSLSFLEDLEQQRFIPAQQQCRGHLITWAFVWEDTPEGYDYWYRRRLWYEDYLKTNKL